MTPLALLLAQLVVILLAARVASRAARALGQPGVVGEMAAGLVLGPTVLGALLPGAWAGLFPAASLGVLSHLGQVGLLLFMFAVGLSIDPTRLAGRGRTAVVVSHASIVVPFALGVLAAPALHGRFAPAGVPLLPFALFVGAALSVTAFPVLARILEERRLADTPLGALVLACAAVDDVTAWCLLAVVALAARALGVGAHGGHPLAAVAGALLFAAAMLLAVRPLLRRVAARALARGGVGREGLGAAALFALACALVTEALGLHALFGAFLAGAVMPRDERLVGPLRRGIEDVVVVVFLPIFFAYTGLRTRVDLAAGAGAWGALLLVSLLAVAGKLGGSAVAARLAGLRWRESLAVGVLMNTRGLMGLAILNVGLDVGVVSRDLFSLLVLVALATTAMTAPLLARLRVTGTLPAALAAPDDARMAVHGER